MSNPNRLIGQTSPYLLQHVNNPVDWQPWSPAALAEAKQLDKPIIVSIGYSACHWCHVMERESFENVPLAQIMNAHFVCIKIDREERPDIDQIYMEAVQQMGVGGGWPLNVFLMPDGRPFYGGTYFAPKQWQNLLLNIANAFENHRPELDKSAGEFTKALQIKEVQKYGLDQNDQNNASVAYNLKDLTQLENLMSADYDLEKGGSSGAPKFPMPSIYVFLLRAWHQTQQVSSLNHTINTLTQMAYGGIYDQIGGGFSRYSTDADWFAPHFEKMLYDNGQLLSLYSEAFQVTKNPLFEQVILQTAHFVARELTSPEGGFYAALDADSEGVEGLFYVWEYEQIKNLISDKPDFELFASYYNLSLVGNWEHGRNILFRKTDDSEFAKQNGLTTQQLHQQIGQWQQILLNERQNRIRPGLDDKILAGWNGLMLKGLADAYRLTNHGFMLNLAQANAEFILTKLWNGQILYRSYKNNEARINGFCEDYAFVIEGLIALYQADFQDKWLLAAQQLMNRAIVLFYDSQDHLFFYTDRQHEQLIADKKEIFDNVIPSSNAAMAHNLLSLSMFFDDEQAKQYGQIARLMLARVWRMVCQNPRYMSYWAALATRFACQNYQIAIAGPDYLSIRKLLDQSYNPNKIMAGTASVSDLPLLSNRAAIGSQTLIHVCAGTHCFLPVEQVSEAIALMRAGQVS